MLVVIKAHQGAKGKLRLIVESENLKSASVDINLSFLFEHHDNKIIKYKNKTFQIIDQFGYDDYFIFLQFVIYRRRTDKPSCSSCFIRRKE